MTFRRSHRIALGRRLAVGLVALSTVVVLPVARGPEKPNVRRWVMKIAASEPLRAPGDFGMVGVAWPSRERAPKTVQARTSTDGRHWSRWRELEANSEDGPDAGTEGGAVRATQPLWVGHARYVQTRFGSHGERAPKGAAVHVVDPGPDPRPAASSAFASAGKPGIITRAQWGADESIRRDKPDIAEPLKLAVVHHTATADSYGKSESARIVRSIYAYHVKTNGWDDIGYNFLVDRYGQIFEGRYGGIDRTVVGAHAKGFNRYTAGVSFIGTFSSALPPYAGMQALKKTLAWRLDVGSVNPRGSVTYISGGSPKWKAGAKVPLKTISDHNDVGQTACPGVPLNNALPSIRDAVAAIGQPKLYDPRLSYKIITPNADGVADGVRVRAGFGAAVNWKAQVLDSATHVLFSAKGTGTSMSVPWSGRDKANALAPQGTYRFKIWGENSSGQTRVMNLSFAVWRYPNGTMFWDGANGPAYVLAGGKLRHVVSYQALVSRYRTRDAVKPGTTNLKTLYPAGAELGFRDGSVVRADGRLYAISDGKRRPTTKATLEDLGYDLGSVVDTSAQALATHAPGTTLAVTDGYPNGAALRSTDMHEAWMLGGLARPFVTQNVRRSYQIRDVDLVGDADAEITAGLVTAPVKFRDGSLLRGTGDSTVYVIADGTRRPVRSDKIFATMRYRSDAVRTVTEAELNLQPLGPTL